MEYIEQKTHVLERVPPGDKWRPVGSADIIIESLTDALEWCFQKTGCRDYYLAAFDGKVYSIDKVEKKPEPVKTFNLYGE